MARKRVRSIIAVVVVLAAVCAGLMYWRSNVGPLNVILVTFDTTRADHLGVYGYQKGLTSNFDKFAKGGVVFERAYAPAPITLPSHATMMTGLYPPEHGLRMNGEGRLSDKIPNLPELLKQRGYDTSAFVAAFVLDSRFGLSRGFETYDDDLSKSPFVPEYEERRREGGEIIDSAISWLRKRTSKPFFCWVHFFDAHGPYNHRPEKFGDQFKAIPYDAGVANELRAFDRLVSFLKESKLDKNTLVIVAADHGEGLDEHQENEHSMLVYNSTLHVPLVFACPRVCKSGLRVAQPVSLVDLMPTILDILEIPAPKHVSGKSLRASLGGGKLILSPCYAEAETPYVLNHWCPLKALISGRWKFIDTKLPELYDLGNDPGELVNLVDSQVDVASDMRNLLETIQTSFEQSQPQSVNLTEKDRARLEGLGYVAGNNSSKSRHERSTLGLPDVKEMLPYLVKYEKARLLGLELKFDEAIPVLQEITRERPDYTSALLLLGSNLYNVKRYDEAIEAFRPVIASRPDFLSARMNLARTFIALSKFEEAAAELRAGIERDSENSFAHHQLAEILRVQKKFDAAIVEYQESIRISPDFVIAHIHLGQLLVQLDRFREAIPYFRKALDDEPTNSIALTNLLRILVQEKNYDLAFDYCQKSVYALPTSFEFRFNLGVVLSLKKRHPEAIVQFREAQRLRPDDPRPRQQIQNEENALNRLGK